MEELLKEKHARAEKNKEKILAIMESYGLEGNPKIIRGSRESKPLADFWGSMCADDVSVRDFEEYIERQKEVARFIQLLRGCRGSKLTIKGVITNPAGNQIKGIELTATISSEEFQFLLDICSNSYLYRVTEGFPWSNDDTCLIFYPPLSDDKLGEILEKDIKDLYPLRGNALKGCQAKLLLDYILPETGNWSKTKQYSLIYDFIRLQGKIGKKIVTAEGFSGDIGREKFQEVSNWLKAYQKQK